MEFFPSPRYCLHKHNKASLLLNLLDRSFSTLLLGQLGGHLICGDGYGRFHMYGADQAPTSGEGPRRQGRRRVTGEDQVPAEDLQVGEQHHHASAQVQGGAQGHQRHLRPVW